MLQSTFRPRDPQRRRLLTKLIGAPKTPPLPRTLRWCAFGSRVLPQCPVQAEHVRKRNYKRTIPETFDENWQEESLARSSNNVQQKLVRTVDTRIRPGADFDFHETQNSTWAQLDLHVHDCWRWQLAQRRLLTLHIGVRCRRSDIPWHLAPGQDPVIAYPSQSPSANSGTCQRRLSEHRGTYQRIVGRSSAFVGKVPI